VSSVKDGIITGNTISSTIAGEAIKLINNENVAIRGNRINQAKP